MSFHIEKRNLDPTLLPSFEPRLSTDADLVEPVLEAIQAAVLSQKVVAASTSAGRIFARKNEQTVTCFSDAPNTAYSSDNDDVYLQIAVRVSHRPGADVLAAIAKVESISNQQRLTEAQEQLEQAQAKTRAAQQAEEKIQAEIDRLSTHVDKEL